MMVSVDVQLKSTERYEQEMAELKKTMTMKTVRMKQQLTVKLQSKAQQETATMVKAQSDQMLKLLKEKEDELKKALEDEIVRQSSPTTAAMKRCKNSVGLYINAVYYRPIWIFNYIRLQ